jgi:hypothetical protein
MTPIPTDPNVRLRRAAAAKALTAAGYQISAATLASMATRGGGPRYRIFGHVVDYCWADLVEWAEGRVEHRGGTATKAAAAVLGLTEHAA